MKRIALLLTILVVGILSTSCSSFTNGLERNIINITNSPAHVICYSGGNEIMNTTTMGKVTDDANSDGFFFRNQSGKLIEVTADCVFTYQ